MRETEKGSRLLMPEAIWKKAIAEAAPYAHTVIFHFQGEPLLHPQLHQMIAYAHGLKLYTMLSTNGQLLTEEVVRRITDAGLDRIIVSVDGLTEESYAHYRVGGSLSKTLSGIRYLSDYKRQRGVGPEIVMQCLYLASNEQDWAAMRSRYKELGADRLEMKTAQFYAYETGHPDMPTDPRYSRYVRQSDGRYRLKKRLSNRCYRLWSGCVVTADGAVLPCCFDKDHRYVLGRITDASLPHIMHSDAADRFRLRVLTERKNIAICTNCTE